ncbi:phosphoadenosine phosphosulfate reductase (plasmid) [Kitasatospora sp. NBC_00374]|uniref:phosphoadenosine phosphosulfate reductase n=1 Tax=Kitasatospora sp. NBC_00374 TaxID=2975964 RepID=UPI002F91089D
MTSTTITPGLAPDLTQYDIICGNLSGGADSRAMQHVLMEAAGAAGVADRVWTFHASLGPMEWPAVNFGGHRYASVAELAAQQSRESGVPSSRHMERTKTRDDGSGGQEPYDLLTYTALYGRFMRLGTRYCTKGFKEQLEEASHTPEVRRLRPLLGQPVRILKVLGLRGEESTDRARRPAYRCVKSNGSRHVDEWLPAKDWTKEEVRRLHADRGYAWHWCYDSEPGAGDWLGSSRCSCSSCFLASRRDSLLGVLRRPRIAEAIALVEEVRGDSFRPDVSMADLIALSKRPGAPVPGIVIEDEGKDFARMMAGLQSALEQEPRRLPELSVSAPPRRLLPMITP